MLPPQSAVSGGSQVDLFWLPLGAGGHSVRLNGRVYETMVAAAQRRERRDLYHAALEVTTPDGRFVIEQAPAWSGGGERGVVGVGAVGARAAGRLRLFRYEVRCWRNGVIPDRAEAIDSPVVLSTDPVVAARVVALAPDAPRATWGRDELDAGEMWNSNSLVAWVLARSGRAPGWDAGVTVARRRQA